MVPPLQPGSPLEVQLTAFKLTCCYLIILDHLTPRRQMDFSHMLMDRKQPNATLGLAF